MNVCSLNSLSISASDVTGIRKCLNSTHSEYTILRTAETGVNHSLKTYNSLIPLIELLDAPDLFAGEPVPHLLLMEFIGHLGVELLIVDDCLIVDKLPLGNANAEIASGTCRIVRRRREFTNLIHIGLDVVSELIVLAEKLVQQGKLLRSVGTVYQ